LLGHGRGQRGAGKQGTDGYQGWSSHQEDLSGRSSFGHSASAGLKNEKREGIKKGFDSSGAFFRAFASHPCLPGCGIARYGPGGFLFTAGNELLHATRTGSRTFLHAFFTLPVGAIPYLPCCGNNSCTLPQLL
jgi:hypothetical protein